MTTHLAELIAALPAEEESQGEFLDTRQLQQLFDDLAQRRTPVTPLQRLCALGGLQAQIALAYLAHWLRCWFHDAESNQRDLRETHLRVAVKLLRGMGYLRGAVMKVGQTLANLPEIVPDQVVETLEKLHFEAPPMHFALLREHVRNELGGDPEDVFGSFETRPFAAASLGQVHRATLKSGERVAVKIQYPGIGTTIRSDFRNLLALMLPVRLTKDWENLKEQLADLQNVLEWETDYEREAETLRKARSLFREDDRIVVPRVFEPFSTRRLLTMEYLDGLHVHDFLATNPAQELRDHFGAQIIRAWQRLYYAGRMNYADLHPGNFLFQADGTLGVLDFGCVRPFNDKEWGLMYQAHRVIHGGDREELLRWMKRVAELPDDYPNESEHMRLLEKLAVWSWRPLRHARPFDFADGEHLREGMEIYRELTRKRYTRGEPLCVLMARENFGYRAMLYRLRARVDVPALDRQEIKAVGWTIAEPSPSRSANDG
jgi:predicted unusual protein kinase regulating ubiquinone biosynthesis (AarF/ABC1/UbiB family)